MIVVLKPGIASMVTAILLATETIDALRRQHIYGCDNDLMLSRFAESPDGFWHTGARSGCSLIDTSTIFMRIEIFAFLR